MEEEEAKKIVESITDSITSGEKKDIEESTRDIVKKAALAVGSLKETEFDIRFENICCMFMKNFEILLTTSQISGKSGTSGTSDDCVLHWSCLDTGNYR